MDRELRERIDRLEATEAIRQLAYRYALAVDTRDLDALADLWIEDVWLGPGRGVGRDALKQWFGEVLRGFAASVHGVMNHVIEFEDRDHAYGVVYCRAEHDTGEKYIVQAMQYWDRYARRDGDWYIERRIPLVWYASDVLARPIGDPRVRWPDRIEEATLPGWWPSWDDFWSRAPAPGEAEPRPQSSWLARLRRGMLHPARPAPESERD